MPRIRTIKPDFWTDEKIVELPIPARLFFIGMWNFADDFGNLARSPQKLKMQIYPADVIDVEPLVQSLIAHELITEYSVNGHRCLHINGFRRHQTINRPTGQSQIPRFEDREGASLTPSLTERSLTEGEGEGEKEKEKEVNLNPTIKGRGTPSRTRAQEPPPSPPPLDPGEGDDAAPCEPSKAAVLSRAFRTGNVWGATPANPRIIALAEAGVTREAVADVCAYAHECLPGERVPVKWALTALEGWLAEGRLSADVPLHANGHGPPRKLTPVQQREADARAFAQGIYAAAQGPNESDVIDVTATEMSHAKRLKNS